MTANLLGVVGAATFIASGCTASQRGEDFPPGAAIVGNAPSTSSASLEPTAEVDGPLLRHYCPGLAVDAEDRILAIGLAENVRLRPRPEGDSSTMAVGTLLEAGYLRPIDVLRGRGFDIASAPTVLGALVTGVVEGEGPCGLGVIDDKPVLVFYDASGGCLFGKVLDDRTTPDTLALFDEDHVYVGGRRPVFVERYNRKGERVFRDDRQHAELPDDIRQGGPVPDWGFQRMIAMTSGVVVSDYGTDGARIEALSERGARRWVVPLPPRASPAWLAADALGNVYASTFVEDPLRAQPSGNLAKPVAGTGPGELHVMKIDPRGRVAWARTFRDANHMFVLGLASDKVGDLWLLGLFFEKVSLGGRFDLKQYAGASPTDFTSFVMRLGSADGQTQWATPLGEVNNMESGGMARQSMLFTGPRGDVVMKLESFGQLRNVPPRPHPLPSVKGNLECSVLRLRSAGATTEVIRVW